VPQRRILQLAQINPVLYDTVFDRESLVEGADLFGGSQLIGSIRSVSLPGRKRSSFLYPMWRLRLIIFAWFGPVLAASAHPILQDTMWVQFEPSLVRVSINVSLKEIYVAQGIPQSSVITSDAAVHNGILDQHGDYILKHLSLSSGKTPLHGSVIKVTPPSSIDDPVQTIFKFELTYAFNGAPPEKITFRNEMLDEQTYAAGTKWDQSYVIRAKRWDRDTVSSWLLTYRETATLPTGWEKPATLSQPAPTLPALPERSQFWRITGEHLWHGIMHILTGYDHLLFVCALVIATRSFWEMARVIVAFTLAHSLTLALCVFGIFRLPAYVVEPVIAVSIIFVSLENILRPERTHSRARLLVAFGFGLMHGLGFAGGLLDVMSGLPAAGIWLALAGFSLGVEIGHQLVVLPLFALLKLGRLRMPEQSLGTAIRYGSAAISCGGAYYLIVAVHDQFFLR